MDTGLGVLHLDTAGVVFNATSGGAGNATLYQPLSGNGLKAVMIKLNGNFKNGTSVLNCTLPTPFTKFAIFAYVDFQGFVLQNLGGNVTGTFISVWDNPSTIVTGNTTYSQLGSLACLGNAFDTVQITANNANTKNGVLLMVGV